MGKLPLSLISENSYSNHQQLKAGETSTKPLKPSSDFLTTSTLFKSKHLRGDIEQLGILKKRKLIERIGSLKKNGTSGFSQKQSRDVSVSEDKDEPQSKQAKTVDFSKFPWSKRRSSALASLPQDIRETYKQLKNFASDTKSVVNDILSTPGCPPFPPSEWLNIMHWKYVDLAKVLDSAHTTKLDPKKTHVIDEEIELALQVSKSSAGIRTSSDHNIAFSMYIEAIAFVFPQRHDEFMQYNTYISRFFHAMETQLHSRVIEFDQSVRNQMAMQRNLHLTDYSQFEHLRMTFLTSFGIGSNSTASASSSRGRSNRRDGNGGRSDPCHKCNSGTCQKVEGECRFAHCCDRRGCQGPHQKLEYPSKGGT